MPENPPRPNTAKPKRVTFNLDDLLPPAPTPPGPVPTATAVPAPAPKDIEQGRPKRPAKFSRFNEDSANIPAKIEMTQLKLCCDILALGYACASCDGPVSTDEDQHLQGWAWCVIENSADKDASTFHQALFDTATLCKNRGKQKLDAVEALANSIRGTGEKKLIQSAAELCREIIIQDDRLEPGEYAILSTALRGLGVKKVKAEDVAGELLAKDDEFAAILKEANITDLTKPAERDAILSKEWSKYNAYTNLRDQPPAKLEKFRRKMALISKLREIYREMNI
jgi:hypothetical protein